MFKLDTALKLIETIKSNHSGTKQIITHFGHPSKVEMVNRASMPLRMLSKFRSALVHSLFWTSISWSAPSWYFIYQPLNHKGERQVGMQGCSQNHLNKASCEVYQVKFRKALNLFKTTSKEILHQLYQTVFQKFPVTLQFKYHIKPDRNWIVCFYTLFWL